MNKNDRKLKKDYVLIVDDEEDVCFLLERFLAAKGFRPKCCFSLRSCKEEIEDEEPPALLLLDINLKDGSGLSLLEEKVIPKQTKVIVMSARSHLRAEALAKGADRFIAKPFSPTSLVKLISEERLAG